MARLSRTGSKANKAKAHKSSKTKGRKNATTKRRPATAAKPRKRNSVSDLEAQLQRQTIDLNEALEQQAATADVLKVISRSAFDVQTVTSVILRAAAKLCRASMATLHLRNGDVCRLAVQFGLSDAFEKISRDNPIPVQRPLHSRRQARAGEFAQFADAWNDPDYLYKSTAKLGGYRAILVVPMMRENELIGIFSLGRPDPEPFTADQIKLVQTFSDQAAIAIENARLFNDVRTKTDDLSEALQMQTATADVLKVISRSAFDLDAVLLNLISTAVRLCNSGTGQIFRREGDVYRYAASQMNIDPNYRQHEQKAKIRAGRGTLIGRVALLKRTVMITDAWSDPEYEEKDEARIGNVRAMLGVPLMRSGEPIGAFALARSEPIPFTERQIELVTTFADQAVIAIENARLFNETKDALERQTATADILKVIASSPSDVQPVFEAIAGSAKVLLGGFSSTVFRFVDGMAYLKAFTPTTPEADKVLQSSFPRPVANSAPFQTTQAGEVMQVPDTEAPGYEFKEIARARGYRSMLYTPLTNKGVSIGFIAVTRLQPGSFAEEHVQLLQTFADQAVIAISNVELFRQVQERTRELSASLDNLRGAQDRLVQTEKLASLGQLTAGIAHEIKNPLNFVNNFSTVSAELVDELSDVLKPAALDDKTRQEIDELTDMLKGNLEKVVQHGRRADSIVKNMLLHSREGSGEHRPVDLNALVEESLNLAYHGARAEKPMFNVTIKREFDPEAGTVEVFPQEITRVLINLISNGFYAVSKRTTEAGGFEPEITASTRGASEHIEFRIRDNGTGIPPEVQEKMFNPFFTTKPAGEGTGLGLSMSHDIIVKQHGGTIHVDTKPGVFTEFVVMLPRAISAQKPARSAN